MTCVPSIVKPGSERGREPVAMITFFGISISFSSPLFISTETVPPGDGEKIDGPNILPVPS